MPKRTLPEPRTWLADTHTPNEFGRTRNPDWKPATTPTDLALVAAAKQQHETALRVRTLMRQRGRSTETLAADLNVTVDQLRRLLRGEAHLSLADYFLVNEHLRARHTPRGDNQQ